MMIPVSRFVSESFDKYKAKVYLQNYFEVCGRVYQIHQASIQLANYLEAVNFPDKDISHREYRYLTDDYNLLGSVNEMMSE